MRIVPSAWTAGRGDTSLAAASRENGQLPAVSGPGLLTVAGVCAEWAACPPPSAPSGEPAIWPRSWRIFANRIRETMHRRVLPGDGIFDLPVADFARLAYAKTARTGSRACPA